MPKIAISYRRNDSSAMAGRIFDVLARHYGRDSVFMDIDAIPPGVDFRKFIEQSLQQTDVLVALIGPKWLGRVRGGQPRIMDPLDPVRVELETALNAEKIVIPVLVERAKMPRPADLPESLSEFSYINATQIDEGRDFGAHMDRLVEFLDSRLSQSKPTSARSNIRERNTSFVGRAREISELTDSVKRNRMITLCGPGGVGKTRVALEVAKKVASEYRDGVWLVEFAPVQEGALVTDALAAALGIRSEASLSLNTALRSRQMLLVFDNCEHLLSTISSLAQQLVGDCPSITIVATSREPLAIEGEQLYRIDPFETPPAESTTLGSDEAARFDSVRLFVERARSADRRFVLSSENAATVGMICLRLDGIPLALEIAAARVNVLSLDDLLKRLGDRLQLARRGSSGVEARHATLRATIDWSHGLLASHEQALFRRLAIFIGGWSLDAAASVCSAKSSDLTIDDLLASLVDKSLVSLDLKGNAGRYHFLETTREYALDKLGVSGEQPALQRKHAAWNAEFADRAYENSWSSPQPHWLSTVMPEIENVRSALHWALADGHDLETAGRITGGLVPLWQARSLGEGRRYVERIQERWIESGDARIEALLWIALAATSVAKRRVDGADRAEALYVRLNDRRGRAEALRQKAEGLRQMQLLDDAKSVADEALYLFDQLALQNSSHYPSLLQTYASILDDLGRKDEARATFHDALRRLDAIGDEASIASAKIQLAELEFVAGNVAVALSLADEARSACRRIGDVAKQTAATVNLAAYHIVANELTEARVVALEALELALVADIGLYVGFAMQHLGTIAALTGDAGRGALLLSYVDQRFKDEGFQREGIEQQTYDVGMAAARNALTSETLLEIAQRGARLSQPDALAGARK